MSSGSTDNPTESADTPKCYCVTNPVPHDVHYLLPRYRTPDGGAAYTWTDVHGENWNNGPWIDHPAVETPAETEPYDCGLRSHGYAGHECPTAAVETLKPMTEEEIVELRSLERNLAGKLALAREADRAFATIDALQKRIGELEGERDGCLQTIGRCVAADAQAVERIHTLEEKLTAAEAEAELTRASDNLRALEEKLFAANEQREDDARVIEQLTRSVHAVKDADIRALQSSLHAAEEKIAELERAIELGNERLMKEYESIDKKSAADARRIQALTKANAELEERWDNHYCPTTGEEE